MTTNFKDAINHDEDVTFNAGAAFAGTVDLSGATVTQPTGQGVIQFAEQAFDFHDFLEGPTKSLDSLPANVVLVAAHVVITTPLAFSAGTTTGVSVKIGNADDDGFGLTTTLAGSAGYRRPAPGVLAGGVVAGGSGGVIATFTATGGTPNLNQVSAGAGKIVVTYIEV